MQIHELPSASPSASDYIPIDNGTATRKATLSSIDMGSNEITFTSGDTSSPSSWQTVAVMASNTAANLMNAISKMVANIRWLYNRLGTSSTGTTATTVTGAIAEHSTKIGSAEMGTTATTLTGAIAEVNDSVNTNTEDIATLNSNPCNVLAFAVGRLSANQGLTTAYRTVNMGAPILNIGNAFTIMSDGGFKPSLNCDVRITGYIRITGLAAGDVINLAYGVYSSGSWVSEGYAMRITAPGSELTLPIEYIASAPSSGIIYLRASNQTASRGTINYGQCMVERLALS